jgi:hypothetical protein
MSLREAIREAVGDRGTRAWNAVQIVSGSATNARNRELLTFDTVGSNGAKVHTAFHAMVHTDDDLLAALAEHLGRLRPAWADGDGVALLSESNTVYGTSYRGPAQAGDRTRFQVSAQTSRPPLARALRMTFPLHVSRLRRVSDAARRTGTSPQGSGSSETSINRDQPAAVTDHVPSLAPDLTPAIVELTLANILRAIRRERISAVGIFTTDKRDYLFLSREIVRTAPDVLLFTTEADLLFVHRDYGSFIRGTIVASSYPLFSGSQWLTNPELAPLVREQFPTMTAQGIYNAALVLLDPGRRHDLGDESARPSPALPLIDYAALDGSAPCASAPSASASSPRTVPPIWISVVGRDALWPLSVDHCSPAKGTSAGYMVTPQSAAGGAAPIPASYIRPPALAWLLLVLVSLAAGLHGLAYLISVLPRERRSGGRLGALLMAPQQWLSQLARREVPLARLFESPVAQRGGETLLEEPVHIERRRFLLICFTALGLVVLWMWHLQTAWRTGAFPQPGWWGVVVALFILVVGAGFVLTILDRASVVGRLLQRRTRTEAAALPARPSPHALIATGAAVLMAIPAIAAAIALWRVQRDVSHAPWWQAQLLLARTLSPDNWVSQAPMVLGMAALLYVWAFWNARQLSMRGDAYDPDSGLFRLLGGELTPRELRGAADSTADREPLRSELAAILASPWRRTRLRLLMTALAVTLLYAASTRDSGFGIDGLDFSRFAWWTSLLAVFMMAHTVSQTAHLTLLLSRTLKGLGSHAIAPAFTRVAERALFDWRLSARPSRAWQLGPALMLARGVQNSLAADGSLSTGGSYAAGDSAPVDLDAAGVALQREPDVAFLRSETWTPLVEVATRAEAALAARHWPAAPESDAASPAARAEELLALLASFVIRDLLSRIVTGLSVALAMALLLLGAHVLSAFQGRQLFVWLDLALIAALAVVGIGILVHFEKDRVLSLAWATTPGRVGWSGGLLQRLAIWIGFTLVPILAARFPELGENLSAWLEPLRKALP